MLVSAPSATPKPEARRTRARKAGTLAGVRTRRTLGRISRHAAALVVAAAPALAQTGPVIEAGDLAVTGFPGTVEAPGTASLPTGEDAVDETFIDPAGASLTVFDVSAPGGPPEAQVIGAPVRHEVPAREIGQVFGVALDDADPANIYVTASSAHGLQVVIPDTDGDGRPERVRQGQSGARWMEGQFGPGGPGAVYRIDGRDGSVTLFAEIAPGGRANRGAGLGNIAFDPVNRQFFVSDFQSGLIHRLDMNGRILESFDHGQRGRPRLGLRAVPPAGAAADIQSDDFDPADPATWGLADERRRVWGLAHHGGRLYYAAVSGPQIWSVGIERDGSFDDDPQWELDVPPRPSDHPVADIAFDSSGRMYLTQRGSLSSSYDYAAQHSDGPNRVLRYRLETPDDPDTLSRWTQDPEEYAVGFPGNFRNAAGGIALGYGYRRQPDGSYGFGACEGTLWSTGDRLRDSDRYADSLSSGGPLVVHGLQGNDMALTRPDNAPPWQSYYVDYDGSADDAGDRGFAGDVAILRDCREPDLRIEKEYDPQRCEGGRCTYRVRIRNEGEARFTGRLRLTEEAEGGARLVETSAPDGSQWTCEEAGAGRYACDGGERRIEVGGEVTLELTWEIPVDWYAPSLRNCVALDLPQGYEDGERYDNRACTYVPRCEVDEDSCVPDLDLEKLVLGDSCDWQGNCAYVVRITNVGGAAYSGPVTFDDILHPGARFSFHRAAGGGWNCSVAGQSVTCSRRGATLDPGDSVEVALVVSAPPLSQGYRFIRNCARIDWGGGQGDWYAGNDQACAEIPRYPPGHRHAIPYLEVDKSGSRCFRRANDYVCSFSARVSNVGSTPYFGDPIRLLDETRTPYRATLEGVRGDPGWRCSPGTGSAARRQTCTFPSPPGGLQPGAGATLGPVFSVPLNAEGSYLENCASVEFDRDGDGTPELVEDCAALPVCDIAAGNCSPDLRLEKHAPRGSCEAGRTCTFSVQINNFGPGAVPAGYSFTDTPDFPFDAVRSGTGFASCTGSGGTVQCTLNARIPRAHRATIPLEFDLPAGLRQSNLENCAALATGPRNPTRDEDCATAHLAYADLTVTSNTVCERGQSCPVPVRVRNVGGRPFEGSFTIEGSLSPDVPIASVSSPGLGCQPEGNGYRCEAGGITVPARDGIPIDLVLEIPADFGPDEITHTQRIGWPELGDANPGNDESSSVIEIVGAREEDEPDAPRDAPEQEEPGRDRPEPDDPGRDGTEPGRPDLAILKTANAEECREGEACGFSVRIENRGDAPHAGPIRLTDRLSAPARLRYAGPGGIDCGGSGTGYTCSHPDITLEPGASTSFNLSFVPGGGAARLENCAEILSARITAAGPGGGPHVVLAVQRALNAGGFDAGPEDGRYGPQTAGGIRAYQRRQGLDVTGEISPALLGSLFGEGDANPANDRACASVPVAVTREPDRDDPAACTGGRVRNAAGNCVCPSARPVWTGQRCIQQQTGEDDGADDGGQRPNCPQGAVFRAGECVCTGGRVLSGNQCACPDQRPVWTGETCVARQQDDPEVTPGDVLEQIPDLLGDGQGDGGQQQPDCPQGQVWRPELGDCVARNGGGDGGGQERPRCPQGQVWAPNLGDCVARDRGGDSGGERELDVPQVDVPQGIEEGLEGILN